MENKYKLPKEFLEKWVTALTGGNYKQSRSMLYNEFDNSYCCLGVAGAICGVPNSRLIGCAGLIEVLHSQESNPIPDEFFQDGLQGTCISMNDIQNMSFLEIADWLEKNIEVY